MSSVLPQINYDNFMGFDCDQNVVNQRNTPYFIRLDATRRSDIYIYIYITPKMN